MASSTARRCVPTVIAKDSTAPLLTAFCTRSISSSMEVASVPTASCTFQHTCDQARIVTIVPCLVHSPATCP